MASRTLLRHLNVSKLRKITAVGCQNTMTTHQRSSGVLKSHGDELTNTREINPDSTHSDSIRVTDRVT